MNFPEQKFLFSVGQLGLWWVAMSHTGGRGAACPASRAGSGRSVPTAPSSWGHARWLYCVRLHCRHGWRSCMLCCFAAASMDRALLPSSGSIHAPQGTSLRGHTTRAPSPGTAQRTTARCPVPAAVWELVQWLQTHAQLLQNFKPARSRLGGTRCCRGPGTPSHCLHRGFLFTSQSSKQIGLRWLWLLHLCCSLSLI